MKSAIYKGKVRHRRFSPVPHEFVYRVFMVWLDLDETQEVFSKSRLWSSGSGVVSRLFSAVRFRREDYFDGTEAPLKQAVQDWIFARSGERLTGPIRMLTNLRIFGFLINPITCYYCYSEASDSSGAERLKYVVFEVTNTPWGQRQLYLLSCGVDRQGADHQSSSANSSATFKGEFHKEMHVSPFHPMNMLYRWRLDSPESHLNLHLDNILDDEKVFDASLMLQREPLGLASMRSVLWRYPFMTLKVAGAIHWQALRLWLKKVPLYANPHPSRKISNTSSSSAEAAKVSANPEFFQSKV